MVKRAAFVFDKTRELQCEDTTRCKTARRYLHALSIIIQKRDKTEMRAVYAPKIRLAGNFSRLEERKQRGEEKERSRRTCGGSASVIVLFLITPRDEARVRERERAERAERERRRETERSGGLLAITLRGK